MLSECTLISSVLLFSLCLAFPADLIYRNNEGDHRSRSDLIDNYYPVDESSSLSDDDRKIVNKKAVLWMPRRKNNTHDDDDDDGRDNWRSKRSGTADQRLQEIRTLLALQKIHDRYQKYMPFDPDKIGRKKREATMDVRRFVTESGKAQKARKEEKKHVRQ